MINKFNKRRYKLIMLSIIGVAAAAALTIWSVWEWPLVSPLTTSPFFSFMQRTDFASGDKKVVYGFVPYWNLDETMIQPELTHLSYFSLTIGANGDLLTRIGQEGEPGFNNLKSDEFLDLSTKMTETNRQVEIVLSQFNQGDISAFLASNQAQDNLINSLDSILLAYPVSGINIDIEPNGNQSFSDRDNLTAFMQKLRQHLNQKYSHVNLSIDVYASAASTRNIWDVEKLSDEVDYIIVMAYDFHRRSSPQAGPVAPLFGGRELWDSDINIHLQEFLQTVPPQKILLGVPFYGYEWQTTSLESQSHTFPQTGSTVSYQKVLELLAVEEEINLSQHWSDEALSPYIYYEEDGANYVLYYENSRSISYKLDYVNQLDLGGIAIWALGYEGNSRELWDVINRKLHQ